MLEVAAAITTSGVFDCVAIGAVASASGVMPKPASTFTLSLTTSSCARRLVTSGRLVSSLTISSTFLPATVSPFCAMYSRAAASICRPVVACWPVIGRIRPILKASCARARPLATSTRGEGGPDQCSSVPCVSFECVRIIGPASGEEEKSPLISAKGRVLVSTFSAARPNILLSFHYPETGIRP